MADEVRIHSHMDGVAVVDREPDLKAFNRLMERLDAAEAAASKPKEEATGVKKLIELGFTPTFVLSAGGVVASALIWVALQGLGMQAQQKEQGEQIRETLTAIQGVQKQVDANKAIADARVEKYAPQLEANQRDIGLINQRIQNMVESVSSLRDVVADNNKAMTAAISEMSRIQASTHEGMAVLQNQLQQRLPAPNGR